MMVNLHHTYLSNSLKFIVAFLITIFTTNGHLPIPIGSTSVPPTEKQNAIPLGEDNTARDDSGTQQVCLTKGCVIAAAEILKSMDDTVNPCQDFYQYACGNWIDSNVIQEDRKILSSFTVVKDQLDNKLRNLIESEPNELDAPFFNKFRILYESCLDLDEIEKLGDEPLVQVIDAMGGWPVLGDKQLNKGWSKVKSNFPTYWIDRIALLRKYGYSHNILIDLFIQADLKDSTRNIIYVDQAVLGSSYLQNGINDKNVAAYYKLMVESAVMLGADEQEAKLQMMDVLQFETKLSDLAQTLEERRNFDKAHNRMNYAELQALAPEIDWIFFFNSLLAPSEENHIRPYNPESDEVIVRAPSFVVKVSQLMKATDPIILTNYVIWRVVFQSKSNLSKKWRELHHDYNGVLTGKKVKEPRWEECLLLVNKMAASSLYVRHHFDNESKKGVEEIVNYIKDEFMKILKEIEWMDQTTKEEALAKAKAMSSYIGYTDELLDDSLIEEFYQGLDYDTNYFNNILNRQRWATDNSFRLLSEKNKKGDWKQHALAATDVNAFYDLNRNSIGFPAGILQGVFYDKSRPNYLNFGSIGALIGHEITHGFDDQGRLFDKDGNHRNWWDDVTAERFNERAQSIIDQYNQYVVPEINMRVNGVITQGENIADNGGLKEAFRAYNQWVKNNGEEPRLPGLDMTPHQLFWMSWANTWCVKIRPETFKSMMTEDPHSPDRFRITGPFSNSKEFSDAFNCPPGAPLNPTTKNSVW